MWETWSDYPYDYELPYDVAQELAYYRSEQARWEALGSIVEERLAEYFVLHPDLAQPAFRCLEEAREQFALDRYSAAVVFSCSAIEFTVKRIMIEPVLLGHIPIDPLAQEVSKMALNQQGYDRFKGIFFYILTTVGVDIGTYKPVGSTLSLGELIIKSRKVRNQILHEAGTATKEQAEQSVAAACDLLENHLPALVRDLRLHLHSGLVICTEKPCPAKQTVFPSLDFYLPAQTPQQMGKGN